MEGPQRPILHCTVHEDAGLVVAHHHRETHKDRHGDDDDAASVKVRDKPPRGQLAGQRGQDTRCEVQYRIVVPAQPKNVRPSARRYAVHNRVVVPLRP